MGGGGPSGGGGGQSVDVRERAIRTSAISRPAPVDARERAISGRTSSKPTMSPSAADRARMKSYDEITQREQMAQPLAKAGLTGAVLSSVGSAMRSKMKSELDKGGTPVTARVGGKEMTVGVVHSGPFGSRVYTGRSEYDPISQRASGGPEYSVSKTTGTIMGTKATREGGDAQVTAEVTPEVTPEVVPDETVLGQAAEAQDKRRRTRTKRVGGGGTMLEGFGALYK